MFVFKKEKTLSIQQFTEKPLKKSAISVDGDKVAVLYTPKFRYNISIMQ